MAERSQWIDERIREVMASVRASKSSPLYAQHAESAFSRLTEEATEFHVPNRNVVLVALDEARATFQSGDITRTLQYLSRALVVATRSEVR